jgi:hypothetical protein
MNKNEIRRPLDTFKAAQRVSKIEVCAYLPADDPYPVLCLQVSVPGPRLKFGRYLSPVVRRADSGYVDLLNACKGSPVWLYDQEPRPLR